MSDIPVIPGNTQFVAIDARGAIQYTGSVPESMMGGQIAPVGGSIVRGVGDAKTDYVLAGVITPRPANTATLSGMTLQTLPSPCTITINGTAHDCTDDHCDLSFSQPGTYAVTVSAWPMLDATFEVTQA